MYISDTGCLFYFIQSCFWHAQPNIVGNAARKQKIILKDKGYPLHQLIRSHITYINPAYFYTALHNIPKSWNEFGNRAFVKAADTY